MPNRTDIDAHPADAAPPVPPVRAERPLGSRAPALVRRSRLLHLCWRGGILAAGFVVVVVGVIMLPLPGPGWLVIFAGMALWGTEFVWAQRVLRWTRRRVAEFSRRALDPRVRRRTLALASVAAAVGLALLAAYLWRFGMAMPWEIAL